MVVVSSGPPTIRLGAYVGMPELVGVPQGRALTLIQEAGLSSQVFNDYSDVHKRGDVIGQLPAGGGGVASGAESVLLVSSGSSGTPLREQVLPEVVGKPEAEAVSALQSAGFSPQLVRQPSDTVPAGVVSAQLPSRASLAVAPTKKSMPWWLWALVAFALVAVGAVAYFAMSGETTVVPDVIGLTQEGAVTSLEAAGLVAEVIAVELAEGGEIGAVLKQDPAAGAEVNRGSVVKLEVPSTEKLVEVPDVRGENQADATRALEDAGFKVAVTRRESNSVDTGLVIEQAPAGGQGATAQSTVEIVISSGPAQELVKVPDVEGLASADAQTALTDLGLKVVIAQNPSTQVAAGIVISQLPAVGDTVAPGTSVGIVVSTGPAATTDEVEAPNVVGVTLAEAQQVMTDAGLEAIPVPSTGSGRPANEVVAQTPEAGASVQKGSGVVLFYSSGQ